MVDRIGLAIKFKNQVLKRQEITKAGSKVLYDYAMKIVDEHTERGNLIE